MGCNPVLDVLCIQPIRYNSQDTVGAGAQPAERRSASLAEHGVEAVNVSIREHTRRPNSALNALLYWTRSALKDFCVY